MIPLSARSYSSVSYTHLIALESSFDELNIDSLDFIEIIIATEDAFNIEFTDEALYMGKFKYISDFTSYISEMIGFKKVKNEQF